MDEPAEWKVGHPDFRVPEVIARPVGGSVRGARVAFRRSRALVLHHRAGDVGVGERELVRLHGI